MTLFGDASGWRSTLGMIKAVNAVVGLCHHAGKGVKRSPHAIVSGKRDQVCNIASQKVLRARWYGQVYLIANAHSHILYTLCSNRFAEFKTAAWSRPRSASEPG